MAVAEVEISEVEIVTSRKDKEGRRKGINQEIRISQLNKLVDLKETGRNNKGLSRHDQVRLRKMCKVNLQETPDQINRDRKGLNNKDRRSNDLLKTGHHSNQEIILQRIRNKKSLSFERLFSTRYFSVLAIYFLIVETFTIHKTIKIIAAAIIV